MREFMELLRKTRQAQRMSAQSCKASHACCSSRLSPSSTHSRWTPRMEVSKSSQIAIYHRFLESFSEIEDLVFCRIPDMSLCFADKTWKVLEDAIHEINNHNASGLSFEELYRQATCSSLCKWAIFSPASCSSASHAIPEAAVTSSAQCCLSHQTQDNVEGERMSWCARSKVFALE